MQPLTLEWLVVDEEHMALVFDKLAFSAFQAVALSRGKETTAMITETLCGVFGTVFIAQSNVGSYH